MSSQPVLLLSNALFCLGVFGMLTRRNAIGLLLSVELILNAAALNFVLFGRVFGHVHAPPPNGVLAQGTPYLVGVHAQAFALFIIALAACEAVVGLAIILRLSRSAKTILADDVNLLKG